MLKHQNKGTYVGVHFTEETLDDIQSLQQELRLVNPVPRDKLHSTICYSRVHVPYIPEESIELLSTTARTELWDTQSGKTLVLCLDSDILRQRHQYSMILGATYDFPDYKPHITLSYDTHGQKLDLKNYEINILRDKEYVDELDTNWSTD